MIIQTLVISLGSALIMSMTQYVAKMKTGEPFDLMKASRTLGAGVVAGIISMISGQEPTLADPASVGTLVGMTGCFDVLSKLGWRLFNK